VLLERSSLGAARELLVGALKELLVGAHLELLGRMLLPGARGAPQKLLGEHVGNS